MASIMSAVEEGADVVIMVLTSLYAEPFDGVPIDFDAETRPCRHVELAILLAQAAGRQIGQVALEGAKIAFAFHHPEIRKGGGQMRAGRLADNAGHADMRGVAHIMESGIVGHAPCFGYAAGTGDIWLQDGKGAVGDKTLRLIGGKVALSGCERHVAAFAKFFVALLVFRRQRLLEPEVAVGRKCPADLDRLVQIIGPVGVDTEFDIVAGAFAQPFDAPAGFLTGLAILTLMRGNPSPI